MKGVKKGSAQALEYRQRKEDERTFWTVKVIAFTQQEVLDAVTLTLHEKFGFGPDRQKQFQVAFDEKYREIHELRNANDDDYSVAVMEKALQAACGKNYCPRDKRYDFRIRVGNREIRLTEII